MDTIFTTSEIIKYNNKYKTKDFLAQVEQKDRKEVRNFCFKIMKIEDPFHSLSLLLRVKSAKPFINEPFLERLSFLIEKIKGEKYLKIRKLDKKIYEFVMRYTEDGDVKAMIRCLSFIKINDKRLAELKRYFSYNLIYQHYRRICKNIFEEKHRRQEISLTIRLMDSPSLCFKNLYPIIKKISKCAKLQSVDKTVIECAKLIGCVVRYEPKAVYDYQDYITSILSFLSGILTDMKTYVFLKLEDLGEILLAIERIGEYKKNYLSTSSFFAGIYARSYDVIYKYNKIYARLEEDLLCLTVNLQLIRILYQITYQQGLRSFNYNQLQDDVVNLKYSKPVNLSVKKYKRILTTFFSSKYRLLDMIYEDQGFCTDMFIKDMCMCTDWHRIFKTLKNLTMRLELGKLIRIGITATKEMNEKGTGRDGESENLLGKKEEQNDKKHTKHEIIASGIPNEVKDMDGRSTSIKVQKTVQDKGNNVVSNSEINEHDLKNRLHMLKIKNELDDKMGKEICIDEKNCVYLVKYTLKRCFLDRDDFSSNLELYKNFLMNKETTLILLAVNTFIQNMENRKYTNALIDLLSFFLALNIEDRNNRIVRRKEEIVISSLIKLSNDKIVIFLKKLFTNLNDLRSYQFNPFLISFVIHFGKEVKEAGKEFVDYILNALKWNMNGNNEKIVQRESLRDKNKQEILNTYTKMYISLVCYISIEHELKMINDVTNYYEIIMMLINCIKVSYDTEYINMMKSKILQIVFDLNEEQRNDLKKLYFIFLNKKKGSESEHLHFYEIFSNFFFKKLKKMKKRGNKNE